MNLPSPQDLDEQQQRFERRHELVHRILRSNILDGHLPHGFVLLEAPIAELLQVSRAPVQRALQQLTQDGLVCRFNGRGYLVGNGVATVEPLRADLREFGLVIPGAVDEALQTRSSWEWIVADLEQAVSSCLVFGEFRMVEAEVAAHFNVSRTVIRDVLGRLQERGLVRKTQSSRWIAGPLTAQALKECYDVRVILEPAALLSAMQRIDRRQLMGLRDRIVGKGSADEDVSAGASPFDAFMSTCILSAPNATLTGMIRQNLMVLDAATHSLAQLGLAHDDAAFAELRVTVDLLFNGSTIAAAEWWRDHLRAACRRNIAQLKIVAVLDRSASFPPYLVPIRRREFSKQERGG